MGRPFEEDRKAPQIRARHATHRQLTSRGNIFQGEASSRHQRPSTPHTKEETIRAPQALGRHLRSRGILFEIRRERQPSTPTPGSPGRQGAPPTTPTTPTSRHSPTPGSKTPTMNPWNPLWRGRPRRATPSWRVMSDNRLCLTFESRGCSRHDKTQLC